MSMEQNNGSRGTVIDGGPVLTKQAFKDEVDINKIISRYERTGMITALNTKKPFYGDVSDVKNYKECLETVKEAESLFMALTPEIRERFHNEPSELIEFLQDKNNTGEAIKLGIAKPKPEPINVDSAAKVNEGQGEVKTK